MTVTAYPVSIDLVNLSDEHQATFALYLRYLLPKRLAEKNRVITDNLFGSTRRAVERWLSLERFPRENVWEQFCRSEGASLFTAQEMANLNRLYRNETPQIARHLRPVIIDPYPQVMDIFFGRLKERWLLQELIRDTECRTVGIVGRAGIGKTALIRRFLRDMTYGQWQSILEMIAITAVRIEPVNPTMGVAWVDTLLDTLTGMYLAVTGTSLALERRPTPQIKLDALWDAIGDQPGLYILILDNAERLFDGEKLEFSAQLFFEKLKDAPANFRIVTLSRRDLTPHLPIRHEAIVLDEGLSPGDAVAFLRQRDPNDAARLRRATNAELQKLAARVGYIPKALEAVVTHFLEDKFATIDDFLGRFPSSEPMADLLSDVYRHLQDDTLHTLQIAATLNDQATLDAIAHVSRASAQSTRISCSQLIDLQLVGNFDRTSGLIQLHALDQEYAYNLLEDTARSELHRRASAYFQARAGNAMTARTLNDLSDHLTAFNHLMKANAYNEAGQWYLYNYADRLRQLERNATMLHVSDILAEQIDDSTLRAGIAFFRSIPLFLSGRRTECMEQLNLAERYATEAGSTYWLVRILSNAALIHSYNGQPETASAYIEAAQQHVAAYEGMATAWLETQLLMRQMVVCLHQGRPEQALNSARRLLTLTDDPEAIATAQGNIGTLLFNNGQYEEALGAYAQLLETSRQHYLRVHHTSTISNIGAVKMEMGQADEALTHYQEALHAATEEMRDKRLQSQILNNLIEVYSILGRFEEAEESFNDAIDLAERTGLPVARATALGEWGWALLQQGRYDEAQSKLSESYRMGEQYRHPELARFGAYLGCAFLKQSRFAEAYQQLESLEPGNNKVHRAFILLLSAIAQQRLNNNEAARILTQQTLDCAAECLHDLPQTYRPYSIYALGLSLQSVLTDDASQWPHMLNDVRTAFTRAWLIANTPGIVHQARLLLDLLRPVTGDTQYEAIQRAVQGLPPGSMSDDT